MVANVSFRIIVLLILSYESIFLFLSFILQSNAIAQRRRGMTLISSITYIFEYSAAIPLVNDEERHHDEIIHKLWTLELWMALKPFLEETLL